jgi:hypothetical protein
MTTESWKPIDSERSKKCNCKVVDWLQAAMIDRLLNLPTSRFRGCTVGDFLDRSMGSILHGEYSSGARRCRAVLLVQHRLDVYDDLKLGLVATALVAFRALPIIATSAKSFYHETKHCSLKGKIGGFRVHSSSSEMFNSHNLSLQVSRFVLGGPHFPRWVVAGIAVAVHCSLDHAGQLN